MKLCIILGTRPEIIKMAPIIKECQKRELDYFVIHTGQHYSYEMDKLFFEELELPGAKHNLDVGSGSHGKQTGIMLEKIEQVLMQEKPDVVFVQGDTNTVLAGALAASKLGIKVGHVEAGLRSYDRKMPEETNRIVADHISDYLFCPTEKAKEILLKEGIDEKKIFVTGNTIVDSVFQNLELAKKKVDVFSKFGLEKGNYFLITAHRPANVDNKENLEKMFKGFESVYNKFKLPLFYPIHPRTKKMIESLNVKVPECVKLVDPVGFLEFLQLEANAKLVLTDSGGVQEETCILRVPCITLRENTERPETIDVGGNVLAGLNPEKILECTKIMLNKEKEWSNPFGDGDSGKKIIDIVND